MWCCVVRTHEKSDRQQFRLSNGRKSFPSRKRKIFFRQLLGAGTAGSIKRSKRRSPKCKSKLTKRRKRSKKSIISENGRVGIRVSEINSYKIEKGSFTKYIYNKQDF